MKLSLPSVAALVLVAAAAGVTAGELHARKASLAAAIVKGDALCTRTAPHGKAWVTPYAAGANAWLGRLELAAGATVPKHRDPTEEYIHVLAGHGKMTIDGKVTNVGPGDTVFMPAGAEVSFANGKQKLSALQVFAAPSPAAKYESWPGCP